jgi:hypothetical protein
LTKASPGTAASGIFGVFSTGWGDGAPFFAGFAMLNEIQTQ